MISASVLLQLRGSKTTLWQALQVAGRDRCLMPLVRVAVD